MGGFYNERSRTNRGAHGIGGYPNERFRGDEKEVKGFNSNVDLFEVGLYALMIVLVLLANFA